MTARGITTEVIYCQVNPKPVIHSTNYDPFPTVYHRSEETDSFDFRPPALGNHGSVTPPPPYKPPMPSLHWHRSQDLQ